MSDRIWVVVCPNCQTENEVKREQVRIECGQATADCICKRCGVEFPAQRDYLDWLGFDAKAEDLT